MSGSSNAHARLSPSSSKRWLSCTASTSYIRDNAERIPPERESPYAAEGTLAHDYAEAVLNGTLDIEEVPEDFRPHIRLYVDHCRAAAGTESEVMVEVRVPLFYSPQETGTADFVAIRPDRIIVRDKKYGQGVPVEAEDNTQLAIYAWSVIDDLTKTGLYSFPPDFVVDIGIVQPRYRGKDPVRIWETTVAELAELALHIAQVADLIAVGEGLRFAPSEDACRWCPAKAICPARAADAFPEPEGIDMTAALAALPDLDKDEKKLGAEDRIAVRFGSAVSDEVMVAIHSRSRAIRAWLDDIEEHLTERALLGDPAPGTKLVQGRAGNRKWLDEGAAEALLKRHLKTEERYTRKLISPTQAEEVLNLAERNRNFRVKFEDLVGRSEGRPVLALESDKRPAVSTSSALDAL
jgi:hypothetical protein